MSHSHLIVKEARQRHKNIITRPELYAGGQYAWPEFSKDGNPAGQMYQVVPDSAVAAGADGVARSLPFVITRYQVDRDGDVVVPRGIRYENFRRNPVVFFGHQAWMIPIGKAVDDAGQLHVFLEDEYATSRCFFDPNDPNSMFIYEKLVDGYLGACSISFVPLKARRRDERFKAANESDPVAPPGWLFEEVDLTEWSVVGVGSNAGAGLIRDALDKEKSFISPELKKAIEPFAAMEKGCFNGWCPCPPPVVRKAGPPVVSKAAAVSNVVAPPAARPKRAAPVKGKLPDPKRWNKQLSPYFEVDTVDQHGIPTNLPPGNEFDHIVRTFLECEIKEISVVPTFVPSPRMGTFLHGLAEKVLASYTVADTRNIAGRYNDGREYPPKYETVKLNSTNSETFLIDGEQFLVPTDPNCQKMIVRYSPDWNGIDVVCYTKRDNVRQANDLIDRTWEWARDNNFLKREAFALSGEFLSKTPEGWDDVFLEPHNQKSLTRQVDLFNEKQLNFANRGMILTGPPGTGKTLSGRIIRNTLKGTFIWVSSRDFHRAGSFGGVSLGFEMAKELAPCVLFMEDVDNWLSSTTIDLIKTEMDGIARSKGVLTILTTNFPEQLPQALIDRPGRFHDVLEFGYPAGEQRRAMLDKWLPAGVSDSKKGMLVSKTDGYSGAHVFELCSFATTLHENDQLPVDRAVEEAVRKVEEQKELITRLQLEGSNYDVRPPRRLKSFGLVSKSCCDNCKQGKPCKECDEQVDEEDKCQTGPNAGKPGPCPKPGGVTTDGKPGNKPAGDGGPGSKPAGGTLSTADRQRVRSAAGNLIREKNPKDDDFQKVMANPDVLTIKQMNQVLTAFGKGPVKGKKAMVSAELGKALAEQYAKQPSQIKPHPELGDPPKPPASEAEAKKQMKEVADRMGSPQEPPGGGTPWSKIIMRGCLELARGSALAATLAYNPVAAPWVAAALYPDVGWMVAYASGSAIASILDENAVGGAIEKGISGEDLEAELTTQLAASSGRVADQIQHLLDNPADMEAFGAYVGDMVTPPTTGEKQVGQESGQDSPVEKDPLAARMQELIEGGEDFDSAYKTALAELEGDGVKAVSLTSGTSGGYAGGKRLPKFKKRITS